MNDVIRLILTIVFIIMVIVFYHFVIMPYIQKILKQKRKKKLPPLQMIRPEAREETLREREERIKSRRKYRGL